MSSYGSAKNMFGRPKKRRQIASKKPHIRVFGRQVVWTTVTQNTIQKKKKPPKKSKTMPLSKAQVQEAFELFDNDMYVNNTTTTTTPFFENGLSGHNQRFFKRFFFFLLSL